MLGWALGAESWGWLEFQPYPGAPRGAQGQVWMIGWLLQGWGPQPGFHSPSSAPLSGDADSVL